jgi:hypothetical protein
MLTAPPNGSRSSTTRQRGTHQPDPPRSACKACRYRDSAGGPRAKAKIKIAAEPHCSISPICPANYVCTVNTSVLLQLYQTSLLYPNPSRRPLSTHSAPVPRILPALSNATVHFVRTASYTTEPASKPHRSWTMSNAP